MIIRRSLVFPAVLLFIIAAVFLIRSRYELSASAPDAGYAQRLDPLPTLQQEALVEWAEGIIEDPRFYGRNTAIDRRDLIDQATLKGRRLLPEDPDTGNLLARAYLILGQTQIENAFFYLLQALDLLDHLHPQHPHHPVTHFNLAFTLQQLKLYHLAEEAWLTAMALDLPEPQHKIALVQRDGCRRPDPQELWTQALQLQPAPAPTELLRELAERDFSRARKIATEKMFVQWAQHDNPEILSTIQWIADQSKEAGPSLSLALQTMATTDQTSLREGLLALAQARAQKQGEPALLAERLFDGREPFHNWALYLQARYMDKDAAEYPDVLARLIASTKQHQFRWEEARNAGLLAYYGKELAEIERWNRHGLSLAEHMNDPTYRRKFRHALAEVYSQYGDPMASLHYYGMNLNTPFRDASERQEDFNGIYGDLTALQRHRIAAYFPRELVHLADESADRAAAAWRQAQTLIQANQYPAARQSWRQAVDHAIQMGGSAEGSGELVWMQADLMENAERRLHLLQQAVPLMQDAANFQRIPQLQHQIAQTYLALGQRREAQDVAEKAVALFEQQRSKATPGAQRMTMMDGATDYYNLLAGIYLDDNRHDQALITADKARARLAWDYREGDEHRLDLAELQSRLAEDEAILFTYLRQDELVTWFITRHAQTQPRRQTVSLRQLITEINTTAGFDQAARQLYRMLLGPFQTDLEAVDKLTIAPHGPLWAVPFAALIQENGNYLIQDWALTVTPGLALHTALDRPSGEREDLGALILGNPNHHRGRFKGSRLQRSAEEASALAKRLNVTPLLDDHASDHAFLNPEGDARLIHFAGHAVAETGAPLQSRLILTPSGPDSTGEVRVADLLKTQRPHLDLAVLSACETGGPTHSLSEGGSNLATAFLMTGASSVVATLYRLDDDADTLHIMDAFYDVWLDGASPAQALQQAQIQAIRQKIPPRDWMTYQVFGRH